ncbi:MAG: polyphosphate polymerase domain-containing protein [Anaerolineae bacterium]|nr:polyphosphate polymerase domain-containing protein [Anaerolineae bacterium]
MRIKEYSRYELKYLLTREQQDDFIEALKEFMVPDIMGDAYGRYPISSLYFDTVDYRAYWDKVEGHKFRRKVRVRVYGNQAVTAETPVFAEIKQRIDKTLQKKRVQLPYAEAIALCGAGQAVADVSATEQAVVEEIQYLYYTLQLQPACVVSYHRVAFNGSEYDPGLRVTFDTNLKCRTHALTLLSEQHGESRLFVPPDWCVMEVKVNYRVPYWLTELIGRHRCTLRRISKYCTALEQSKVLLQYQEIFY